jgi:integrase
MARYTVQMPDGPKQKTIMGRKGESRQDVAERLADALSDRNKGITYDAGSTTVADYLQAWLKDSVRDTVRQRTHEEYVGIVERHLAPTIGRVKLSKLTPGHVRGLYHDKLDSGLAPRTVQYIHRTLTKALKQAMGDGLIPRNVCELVKPPQPRRTEIHPLDTEQVRILLETVRGERVEALYTVAVTAGLRQGELLALMWEDVDLEAGTLQIRRALSRARSGPLFEAPKSGKGRRIRLSEKAIQSLRAHRKRQLEERMEKAGLWEDQGLVFPSEVGTPLSPRNLQRAFKLRLRRAGLPDIRFHDLRHTCATILFSRNEHPKCVQELLGHASIKLTLDTYSHMIEGMDGSTASAMDEALG